MFTSETNSAVDMQTAAAVPETAVPAVPAAPAAPARKRKHPKVFNPRTKHVFTVPGRELSMRGTVSSEHAGGKKATVSVHRPISELTSSTGKPVKELTLNDEVTFYLAPDYPVGAKFRGAHTVKDGKEPMCTLHFHWPTANILPAPETTRKGGKRKAQSAEVESEPDSKARKWGVEVQENAVLAIYVSLDDWLEDKPLLPEISARMNEIKGYFAHLLPADMPDDAYYIEAILDPLLGEHLRGLLTADPAAFSLAMRGFHLVPSHFRPNKPIDLVKVREFLEKSANTKGERFSLILGYDNASVVNETLPDMAFGDNKRALECAAARAQSPDPSDSESNSGFTDYIDLRGSDSDESDDE
jgi:hypothetical protein